ncbi:hypothetical protein EYV94_12965 [Puteibacter caeruleilacunae]|nr:hypothetical protein EYV94_12965 [Puteibacter caeruleilacunae]
MRTQDRKLKKILDKRIKKHNSNRSKKDKEMLSYFENYFLMFNPQDSEEELDGEELIFINDILPELKQKFPEINSSVEIQQLRNSDNSNPIKRKKDKAKFQEIVSYVETIIDRTFQEQEEYLLSDLFNIESPDKNSRLTGSHTLLHDVFDETPIIRIRTSNRLNNDAFLIQYKETEESKEVFALTLKYDFTAEQFEEILMEFALVLEDFKPHLQCKETYNKCAVTILKFFGQLTELIAKKWGRDLVPKEFETLVSLRTFIPAIFADYM